MDDQEYYRLMNRSSSWALQQALKKKAKNAKKSSASKINAEEVSYTTLEARQGRADAEMLMEKGSLEE